MHSKIDTIIFDLGAVLIDWNPRYLYRKIFKTEEEIDWFLENICTHEWNEKQDAGRSFEEATEELVVLHPQHEEAIQAWYGRWKETMKGPIAESVDIFRELKKSGRYKIYALTNWSAETFPWALEKFEFLHWFDGIVVSGVEKTRKPFPEIFNILFDRHKINPASALFIDDNFKNIEGGQAVGLPGIQFISSAQLKEDLQKLKLMG
ncbi:MAG: HAD family phosphatase [Bacteroidota bacterium]